MASRFNFFGTAKAVAIALACAMVVQCAFVLLHAAAGEPWRGATGLDDLADNPGQPGTVIVGTVKPDSAAGRAGVQAGDVLAFDHPADRLREVALGEAIGVTVAHAGQARHLVITADAGAAVSPSGVGFAMGLGHMLANLMIALLAVFALLRAGQSRALLALGAALAFMSDEISAIPASRAAFGHLVDLLPALDRIFYGGGTTLLVYFFIQFAREAVGGLGVWPVRAMRAYVLAFVAVVTGRVVLDFAGRGAWWPFEATFGIGGILMAVFVVMGYRRSAGQTRVRYAMLMLSFLLLFMAQLLMMLRDVSPLWQSTGLSFLRRALFDAFVFTFAYAILRHRVVNLGFVLNRSIVYAVISAMLLVGFGVVEWLAEHLIHFEDREKSVLLDGGIALGVYLVFHHVRHSVEHGIERLFFHRWHANEAALKNFVQEASHIAKADTLLQTFCLELARFSGGASSAVYVLNNDGSAYQRAAAAGDMPHPSVIDGDDPAMLAMQARRNQVALDETRSQLSYAAAFPFFHRGRLLGMALLAPKPGGDAYRPDELEILGWAVHQIGLDQQALTLAALQRAAGEMAHLVSIRDAELAVLRAVVADAAGVKTA